MRSPFRDPSRRQGAFRLCARLLAGVLLALLGAGYALPGLHFAAVAHEICANHGEFHHAEGVEADAPASSERPKTTAVFDASSTVEHAHDHCSVWTSGAAGMAVLRDAAVPVALVDLAQSSPTVRDSAAKPSIDVLSYAPKLAPPA